jgi:hypothetical protein
VNRGRENKQVFAAGAAIAVIAAAALVLVSRSGTAGPAGVGVAATATPAVSDQAKAEAAALLGAAVQQRAEGQLGPALALSDQALGKWPQYDAAQRFVLTAVPQATAVAQNAQATATAVAQAAANQAQAGATARRVYGTKAGLALQRYADAMGSFYQKHREARDQPALLLDAAWRLRTTAALGTMRAAASELTALRPVPEDMAAAAALFDQIAVETAQLGQDYARGIGTAGAAGLPFASARTERAADLLRDANVEIRRAGPAPPPAP